ncbi:MAG TPA: selenium-dependent molybdenum cofactor biosynthesis protein YqeB [Clostridia bacterium]|nr:selenium-dependent molybdenum cofactor biosynthesis protein YqeB [Clostridia bacterium]
MLVLIRGAGDLATGVAIRLHHAGFRVVMTDIATPTAIRRTVAFSEAVRRGEATVEGVTAHLAKDVPAALEFIRAGSIAVLVDPEATCREALCPDALIDAILAKRNTGTKKSDAPVVIALGPGFTAGTDCHAAIETMRGHDLGRVYYEGSPLPDTGTPGEIAGQGAARVLRAPKDGVFTGIKQIGDLVEAGETVALVDGAPVAAALSGVLRGLLPGGIRVRAGMKSGDVDPRGNSEACFTVSDKARALGGAALEAILHFTNGGR